MSISPGASLVLTGDPITHLGDKELQGGTIVNDGRAKWDGEGELKLNRKPGEGEGGKITNNGVFTFEGGANKEITGGVGAEVKNWGTINISYAAGTELRFYPKLDNQGFVNLNSGHAKTGVTEFGGPISIARDSEFRMGYDPSGGDNDDVMIARGDHGPDLIVGPGKAVFGPGCIVHVAASGLGDTVTFQNVDDYSSRLHGAGNLIISGTYTWWGAGGANRVGSWEGAGTTQVGTGDNRTAKLVLAAQQHELKRTIVNEGVIDWIWATPVPNPPPNPPPPESEVSITGLGGSIDNRAGATVNIESSGPVIQRFSLVLGTLKNAGTVKAKTDRLIELDSYEKAGAGKLDIKNPKNTGEVKVNGKVVMSSGTINLEAGAKLVLAGGLDQSGGDLISSGRVEIVGTYNFSGGTADFSGTVGGQSLVADLVEQTGGTLMVSNGALEIHGGYGQLAGTVELDMSTATTDSGWRVGQYAALYAYRSNIVGDLTNSGLLEIGLINGTNYPNDVLGVSDDFTQTGTGQLTLDASSSAWERVAVGDQATFAGTFTMRVPPGFFVPPGWAFEFITFASYTGVFNTYVLPPGNWQAEYTNPVPPGTSGSFRLRKML